MNGLIEHSCRHFVFNKVRSEGCCVNKGQSKCDGKEINEEGDPTQTCSPVSHVSFSNSSRREQRDLIVPAGIGPTAITCF